MTLKEKFQNEKIYINPYSFKLTKEGVENFEKIVDDYAIEFGNWIGKNTISYHNGKFRINTLTPVFRTSEQLLEIFKKEKGL